jgi:uncharacterized membrane protein YsdA (DUF1294 family)
MYVRHKTAQTDKFFSLLMVVVMVKVMVTVISIVMSASLVGSPNG